MVLISKMEIWNSFLHEFHFVIMVRYYIQENEPSDKMEHSKNYDPFSKIMAK